MRHNEILDVDPLQVAQLREGGPGGLLLWREAADRVEAVAPGHVPGDEAMVIAGVEDLDGIAAQAEEDGEEYTDTYAAAALGSIGGDILAEWPQVKALTPCVLDLRTDMARRSWHLAARPEHDRSLSTYTITDTYRSSERTDLAIRVTTAFMHTSSTLVRILTVRGRREVYRFRIDPGTQRPGMAAYPVAGAIDAAVEVLPRI
ncbi:hypothetical protein FZ103_10585 [Streptomonospora sp. PA3]|uniref:hypothetical protein n=1 Tax=Streptomonospora sp. PA3 TaxID=2607326 RepID=UPI0012DF7058|nr:hypothetical protein [Streptomonospora sp. PA3]MUL41617.1 hypothetical protein [Streptomonospora sp. PA3]